MARETNVGVEANVFQLIIYLTAARHYLPVLYFDPFIVLRPCPGRPSQEIAVDMPYGGVLLFLPRFLLLLLILTAVNVHSSAPPTGENSYSCIPSQIKFICMYLSVMKIV